MKSSALHQLENTVKGATTGRYRGTVGRMVGGAISLNIIRGRPARPCALLAMDDHATVPAGAVVRSQSYDNNAPVHINVDALALAYAEPSHYRVESFDAPVLLSAPPLGNTVGVGAPASPTTTTPAVEAGTPTHVEAVPESADVTPTVVTSTTGPAAPVPTADATGPVPEARLPTTDEDATFARDLAAIVGGERQFSPALGTDVEEIESSPRSSNDDGIFDRMNRDLSYATTFDIGDQELQTRFDTYDTILNVEAQSKGGPVSTEPVGIQMSELEEDLEALRRGQPPRVPEPSGQEQADVTEVPADTESPVVTEALPAPAEPTAPDSAEPPAPTTAPAEETPHYTGDVSVVTEDRPASAIPVQSDEEPLKGEETLEISEPTIRVQHTVPAVQAQQDVSAWAASGAMLVAWRDKVEIIPGELAARKGRWEKYKNAVGSVGSAALESWQLKRGGPTVLDINAIRELLTAHGPLLVARSETDVKPRVLTAIVGDETDTGTMLYFNDPNVGEDKGNQVLQNFDTFHKWQSEGSKPGTYYAHV